MNYRKLIKVLSCYPNTSEFDRSCNWFGRKHIAWLKYKDKYIASYHPTSITLCLLDLLDKLLLEEM